jgi:CRISPR-associated protein Cmr6
MTNWLQAEGGHAPDPADQIDRTSNASLVFNKFGARHDLDKDAFTTTFKKALIPITLPSGGRGFRCLPDAEAGHYNKALSARAALITARSGVTFPATTDWRFVTGVGIGSPLEVGIELHHVYGVPYWPGAGVKGLTRQWVEHWAEIKPEDQAKIERKIEGIFGPRLEPGDDGGEAGSVVFFDALPEATVALELDVMTPHYGPWYSDKTNAPGDWMNPIPIKFWTVAAGQTFQFGLAPRGPRPEDQADYADARTWLLDALQWLGAGAKTKVGYGRFNTPPKS